MAKNEGRTFGAAMDSEESHDWFAGFADRTSKNVFAPQGSKARGFNWLNIILKAIGLIASECDPTDPQAAAELVEKNARAVRKLQDKGKLTGALKKLDKALADEIPNAGSRFAAIEAMVFQASAEVDDCCRAVAGCCSDHDHLDGKLRTAGILVEDDDS